MVCFVWNAFAENPISSPMLRLQINKLYVLSAIFKVLCLWRYTRINCCQFHSFSFQGILSYRFVYFKLFRCVWCWQQSNLKKKIFRKCVDSARVEFVMSFCEAIVDLNYCKFIFSTRTTNMYFGARILSMLTFDTNNSRCVVLRYSSIELCYILYDCLIYFRSYKDYTRLLS